MSSSSAVQRVLSRLRVGDRARLVVEAGENTARVLLVRRDGAALRIEREVAVDLRADGLLGPGEMAARLRALLAELPAAPVTVVLPPGRTHSQLMDLRADDGRAVADLARAVGGRQFESVPSIFDARPVPPTARHSRPMWVSIAREADVEMQLLRCGLPPERVSAVIGADAALAAARALLPESPRSAVFLEMGPVSSLLVVVEDDAPVFAADLDWGTAVLVSALASDLDCGAGEAEAILARDGAEALGPATPRLAAVARRLAQTVDAFLHELAREGGRQGAELSAWPVWLSGPAMGEGRIGEIAARVLGEGRARLWPELPTSGGKPLPLPVAAVSAGAALVALELAPSPPNLAPAPVRAARRVEAWTGGLQAAALVLALAGLAAAGFTLKARTDALSMRNEELDTLRAAKATAPALVEARASRGRTYLDGLPALYFRQRSRDFVAALRLLGEQRASEDFWFTLIADQETYRADSLPQGSPSAAPETQLLPAFLARPTGLVVELSFRPGGEDPLARVDDLIAALRASDRFEGVDILPARSRQATLADRSVFAAEGADFALQLDAAPFDGEIPGAPAADAAGGGGLFQTGGPR